MGLWIETLVDLFTLPQVHFLREGLWVYGTLLGEREWNWFLMILIIIMISINSTSSGSWELFCCCRLELSIFPLVFGLRGCFCLRKSCQVYFVCLRLNFELMFLVIFIVFLGRLELRNLWCSKIFFLRFSRWLLQFWSCVFLRAS